MNRDSYRPVQPVTNTTARVKKKKGPSWKWYCAMIAASPFFILGVCAGATVNGYYSALRFLRRAK